MVMVNIPQVEVNPIALRKAKIVCNFGLSECNRVKPQSHVHGSGHDSPVFHNDPLRSLLIGVSPLKFYTVSMVNHVVTCRYGLNYRATVSASFE